MAAVLFWAPQPWRWSVSPSEGRSDRGWAKEQKPKRDSSVKGSTGVFSMEIRIEKCAVALVLSWKETEELLIRAK